jgi:hypothetical protein
MKTTLEKLNEMMGGKLVVCSDAELDSLVPFDVSNAIRSRPNPAQVGTLDRWECWIERRDIKNMTIVVGVK